MQEIVLRSRIFLGGQAVSLLGDGIAVLAIPLLVLQLTGSPVLAVLASAPRSVGYLAAGLPAGILADRLDPWRVLVAADIVRASVFLGLFILAGQHRLVVWPVLALAFVAGGATVFFETALAITVRDLFAGPRLVPANSRLEAANQGGQVIGPGVAGLLAAAGLLRGTMLIDALTFGVSLASLGALRGGYRAVARAGRTTASLSALRRDLADGVRYLAATRLLLALMGFVLVLNLCLGADKLFVFFAKDTLGLSAWQVGVVVTVGGAGGVLGAAATGWWCRRVGPLPAVASCAVASGVALIMLSTAWSMPVMMAANLLYTWAIVAASVTLRALRQVLVPRELLGRVTAAWRLAAQVVTPIGAVAAGAMTGALGGDPRAVFAVAGALTILTVGGAWAAGVWHADAASVTAASVLAR
jgi:MFS family permease